MAAKWWKCQRVTGGEKCGVLNPNRRQVCVMCGKKRPAKRKPEHMAALDRSYEEYIDMQGGEFCGICGFMPSPEKPRKLDRDHDHRTGQPRGLLCWLCNKRLDNRVDSAWLRAAANYLERLS